MHERDGAAARAEPLRARRGRRDAEDEGEQLAVLAVVRLRLLPTQRGHSRQ